MRQSVFLNILSSFFSIALLTFSNLSHAQEKFLHFTEVDGLPRNITTCLEQDQYGYLWIGTTNGIARYDGNNFHNYKELKGISILNLLYDTNKNLWVATGEGLYKYNRVTDYFNLIVKGFIPKIHEYDGNVYFMMFSNIFKVNGNQIENFYKGNNVSDFCFSKEGLWLAKSDDGIWLLNIKNGSGEIIAQYLRNEYVSFINKIDNQLYFGCYNGQLYSIIENKLKKLKFNNQYFPRKFVKVGQEIWLATDGNGIIVFDKSLNYIKTLNRNRNTEASINSNSIYDIVPGKNSEIWLASYGAGLTCILPDNLLFQNITPEKGNENSLVANEGVSVFVKKNNVYFGTNYGLSIWNVNTRQYKNLGSDKLKRELNGTKVTAIEIDPESNIWVGTYDGLLGKYTPDYKLIKKYCPSGNSLDEMQQIIYIRQITKTNLLVLTHFQNNILINFNTENDKASVFELDSKGSNITYFIINTIRQNQKGELLALVSDKGLLHINLNDNILENRLPEMNNRLNSYIVDFYQDKKGVYWIATSTGLLSITEDVKHIKKYSTKEGLPSNNLVRIESVDDRFLWISTVSGICRFDTKTEEVLNFNHNDGLPANEFYDRVSAKTDDGRIIFGSLAGFTIVDPSKVNTDTSKTEIIISDITFQNQSIRNPEGKQFLKQPLEDAKEIRLPYNKNSFSIHFFIKQKNYLKYHNYAYRLRGMDNDWLFLTETNYANYTNLSPGTYTFDIKSADKSKDVITTSLIIHIQSPWYLSWYAYIVYFIVFVVILYLSVYAYLKRLELKKEKEISEFKILKEHELTEKKLSFFTNVSHDLKTPLTLIDAPVNDLLKSDNLNQEQLNKLMIINRNSKRLYKLITDLLDFRKITQKQHVLEVKETLVSDIIVEICEAFKEECRNKSIGLKCVADNNIKGFIDAKKIEKILWNLLSNAIKYTKSGGTISLGVEEFLSDGSIYLKFEISDTGIGISANDINKIFDRFYKAKNSEVLNQEGTGIGLSIVKELVELHHGKIKVVSEIAKGSLFTIVLPSGKESYSNSELVLSEKTAIDNPTNDLTETTEIQQIDSKKQYNRPVLLIVEDNAELRDYLAGHFEKRYKVNVAEDGVVGLKLAKDINPDIILTDVQMPNMNGYEFCKEIRRNFDTSHIPIVMLTANNTIELQIEGLSTGADSYFTKPFDINLLDAQLSSLLENRKTLRSKFQGIETPENLEKNLPQKDIDFILELKLFIEENIMNQDLNVELLSKYFAVSLAQLHRKIKSLTGSTPNNLIKSIRLKKAYLLIRDNGMRVSEAAYHCGFSDPNYFTVCFKKEFGENPSQIVSSTKDHGNQSDVASLND